MNSPQIKYSLNTQLSAHFSLEEATFSATAERMGVDNTIVNDLLLEALINTADNMELVRAALNDTPLHVNSWYRCLKLNRLLGSKDTGQHPKGEAVDFKALLFGSCVEVCKAIIANGISFDQLILEHSWVHISFKQDSTKNRNQVLTLLRTGRYALGLSDALGKPLK